MNKNRILAIALALAALTSACSKFSDEAKKMLIVAE